MVSKRWAGASSNGGDVPECRPQGFEAQSFAQPGPREHRRIRLCRARRDDYENLLGDGLEVGAKMHGALEREDAPRLRLDADMAEHFLVRRLTFARCEHHAHAVLLQYRHRPQIHAKPREHRAGTGKSPIFHALDRELSGQRHVAFHAGNLTELEYRLVTDADGVRS